MVKELLNRIYFSYQRLTRGYDDRLFWSLSDYVDPMIVACINYHLEHGHGMPINVTEKKWRKALNTILEGLQPEPDIANKKVWAKYLKNKAKARVLLSYYWDELWD